MFFIVNQCLLEIDIEKPPDDSSKNFVDTENLKQMRLEIQIENTKYTEINIYTEDLLVRPTLKQIGV